MKKLLDELLECDEEICDAFALLFVDTWICVEVDGWFGEVIEISLCEDAVEWHVGLTLFVLFTKAFCIVVVIELEDELMVVLLVPILDEMVTDALAFVLLLKRVYIGENDIMYRLIFFSLYIFIFQFGFMFWF